MKLFIPKLGTALTLAQPWTVTVYDEHRNASLIELAQLREKQQAAWANRETRFKTLPLGQFVFPKGAVLTVERIYIRQGVGDFDSVTFRARDYTTVVRTGLKTKKPPTVRFWAKLDEVNEMVIQPMTALDKPTDAV